MEHWQVILCGYAFIAIIAVFFFLIKIIRVKKKALIKTESVRQRLTLLACCIQSLTIIIAAMAMHLSYLFGDINLACPFLTVLALLFIMASFCNCN